MLFPCVLLAVANVPALALIAASDAPAAFRGFAEAGPAAGPAAGSSSLAVEGQGWLKELFAAILGQRNISADFEDFARDPRTIMAAAMSSVEANDSDSDISELLREREGHVGWSGQTSDVRWSGQSDVAVQEQSEEVEQDEKAEAQEEVTLACKPWCKSHADEWSVKCFYEQGTCGACGDCVKAPVPKVLQDLEKGNLKTFLEKALQSKPAPKAKKKKRPVAHDKRKCGILWFYHIPKCGGMTVEQWLKIAKEQGHFDDLIQVFFSDTNNKLPSPGTDYDTFHRDMFEPILRNPKGKLVAVHHHHHTPGMVDFQRRFDNMQKRLRAKGCDLYRFTFLRQPESRLSSAIVYALYDWNRTESLTEAAGHTQTWTKDTLNNVMSSMANSKMAGKFYNREVNYLLYNNANDKQHTKNELDSLLDISRAANILKSFDVVGLTEDLSTGIERVAKLVGLDGKVGPLVTKRVNVGSHATNPEELPDLIKQLLKANTQLDSKLYNEAVKLWSVKKRF